MPDAPVSASVIVPCVHRTTARSRWREQHLVARLERARQALGKIDRTVAAAGAADRDRQVVAVVARIVGQPARDEVVDVGVHALDFGNRLEEFDHRRIAAGQRAQRRLVMRIRQAADVEHEIGVERGAVLEAERFEQQRELRAVDRDEILDPGAQCGSRQVARVESDAELARFGEQVPLVLDVLGQRALVAGEGMPAARLGEALHQRVGLGVEIEERDVPSGRARGVDVGAQRRQARTGACVERYGDTHFAGLRERRDRRQRARAAAGC